MDRLFVARAEAFLLPALAHERPQLFGDAATILPHLSARIAPEDGIRTAIACVPLRCTNAR
jgi:hypothetical protein